MTRFTLLLLLLGCASAPRARAPSMQCPDNQTAACITGRTCAWDSARQCERCRCADPAFVPLGR
jgi:hypothetical protein